MNGFCRFSNGFLHSSCSTTGWCQKDLLHDRKDFAGYIFDSLYSSSLSSSRLSDNYGYTIRQRPNNGICLGNVQDKIAIYLWLHKSLFQFFLRWLIGI